MVYTSIDHIKYCITAVIIVAIYAYIPCSEYVGVFLVPRRYHAHLLGRLRGQIRHLYTHDDHICDV